ncbi:MAG: endosialidase [Lachnospiraceae bacterium]|nr:endosialidase [Lachnospiraceae bacterium]
MSAVSELIRREDNGLISFGDHTLGAKAKLEDFDVDGNLYKVKTFKELTKLERDGMFVYESEPGTSVNDFEVTPEGVAFKVCGDEDAMITIGLKEDTEYGVTVAGKDMGRIRTNLGGKLSISVELEGKGEISVKVAE